MNEIIGVDTDGLLKAAPALASLGDRIGAIGSQLQERLDGIGPAWGDDANGQAFAATYLPAAESMLKTLSDMRDVLHSTADGLETMARGYAATEEQNKAAVRGNAPAA